MDGTIDILSCRTVCNLGHVSHIMLGGLVDKEKFIFIGIDRDYN